MIMEDKSKKTQKRHPCTPDGPSKRRRTGTPVAQNHIVRCTTSDDLLRCLGLFLCQRCHKLKDLFPTDPVRWLKNIDGYLLTRGYQRKRFLTPGSVVFLYMLCQDLISEDIDDIIEMMASLLTCFYISYCYIGVEISYPVKHFVVGGRGAMNDFWDRCLSYIRRMSSKMMDINRNRQIYSNVLAELQAFGQ